MKIEIVQVLPLTSIHIFCVLSYIFVFCDGQGRLVYPPSRASMWRYQFRNPVDFSDDRLNCGGFRKQWHQNKGRCGPCGDPWEDPIPRPHETGGRYGRGTIVANYTQGQEVKMVSEVTGGSGVGHMTYKVCSRNNTWLQETSACFTYTLENSEENLKEMPVNLTSSGLGQVTHRVSLPPSLTCFACIVQWRYVTKESTGRTEYRACADVTIIPKTANFPITDSSPTNILRDSSLYSSPVTPEVTSTLLNTASLIPTTAIEIEKSPTLGTTEKPFEAPTPSLPQSPTTTLQEDGGSSAMVYQANRIVMVSIMCLSRVFFMI